MFSRLWTLKEAYVKARGLGISGEEEEVEAEGEEGEREWPSDRGGALEGKGIEAS